MVFEEESAYLDPVMAMVNDTPSAHLNPKVRATLGPGRSDPVETAIIPVPGALD